MEKPLIKRIHFMINRYSQVDRNHSFGPKDYFHLCCLINLIHSCCFHLHLFLNFKPWYFLNLRLVHLYFQILEILFLLYLCLVHGKEYVKFDRLVLLLPYLFLHVQFLLFLFCFVNFVCPHQKELQN